MSLAYSYKSAYGESGLSANLWEMEKGELSVYVNLLKNGFIGFLFAFLLLLWSLGFLRE